MAIALALLWSEVALAEPKPMPVDIKPLKDKLQVWQDGKGGIYVIAWSTDSGSTRAFYGPSGKQLYEQRMPHVSRNGDQWSVTVDAPRIAEMRPGYIQRNEDGTVHKMCDQKEDMVLTELTGDKAKAVIDKAQFLTTGLMYTSVLLARDKTGTYYYVDKLIQQYGGKGYRVFIGKRGAMKLTPLADVAADSGGEVFATKNGELRLVHSGGQPSSAEWGRGSAPPVELTVLNTDVNSPLIYSDLGIYTFLGTICDNITY